MVSLRNEVYGVQVGKRYEHRKVLGVPFSRGIKSGGGRLWAVVAKCDCGRVDVVGCDDLRSGHGDRCRSCQIAASKRTHGLSHKELLYGVWCAMRRRCSNPNVQEFHNYGGRGISVCQEWSEYPAFREWALSNGYAEGLEIDRENNGGNYEPGNCRWVTPTKNSRNKRNNRLVTAFGETKCIADWVTDDRCVVSRHTLAYRLNHGWPPETAIALLT